MCHCPAGGVWWLSSRKGRRDGVRAVLLVPAVGALLAGLEGRVVFRAFGQYLRLSPPWSYLAVTVALYGTALLVVLHCAGGLLLGHTAPFESNDALPMVSAALGMLTTVSTDIDPVLNCVAHAEWSRCMSILCFFAWYVHCKEGFHRHHVSGGHDDSLCVGLTT